MVGGFPNKELLLTSVLNAKYHILDLTMQSAWWSEDEEWMGVPPPAELDATTEEEEEDEEDAGDVAGTSFDRSFIDDEHWTWDAFVQGTSCRLCGENVPGSGEEENFGMEHMIEKHFRDLEVRVPFKSRFLNLKRGENTP